MTDTNPAAGGLSEEQRLLSALHGITWHGEPVDAAVERIIAARTEAAERDETAEVAYTLGYAKGREAAEREVSEAGWMKYEVERETSDVLRHRAEAADREVARVKASVEALVEKAERDGIKVVRRDYLRAALSSADTGALDGLLDRERAKAAGEALREARDDIKARIETFRDLDASPEYLEALNDAWGLVANRYRAAAVSPEGGEA